MYENKNKIQKLLKYYFNSNTENQYLINIKY